MTIASFSSTNYFHWVDTPFMQNLLSWSSLGYLLIVVGVVATLLSSYRFLLGYLIAGMVYWLVVEALQFSIVSIFDISSWHGYIVALSVTWFSPGLFFVYRYATVKQVMSAFTKSSLSLIGTKSVVAKDRYIEHTPIYKDYKPRFHN